MKKQLFLALLMGFVVVVQAQTKKAFQFYNQEGVKAEYSDMLVEAKKSDVVLFGELHNNPICHWLQLELSKDLLDGEKKNVIMGAEMFESDDQIVMDEYLKGQIKGKHFEAEVKLWNNYKTDYQPLVEFAKDNELRFIACNIPRRYANYVARNGISSLNDLSEEQKKFIAPLPIEVDLTLPGYKMFVDMGMGHGSEMTPERMAEAQASKDATMAHNILQNWEKGKTFIHFNGTYHSDGFEGIVWYLKKANPKLKVMTISSVQQDDLNKLDEDNLGNGSFILVTPENMTGTY